MRSSRNRTLFLGLLLALVAGGGLAWFAYGGRTDTGATPESPRADPDQLREFAAVRVFFGHQSVGANIINGVDLLYSTSATHGPTIVETRDEAPASGGFLAHAHVGVNGDPRGKFTDFAAVLDGSMGDQVGVAMLKLCYADIVAGTPVQDVFDDYAKLMQDLEARHPLVRFLYTTVPLTTDRGWKSTIKSWLGQDDQMGPRDNLARTRYNELVRSRYAGTGRLFDIAAVEATLATAPVERQLDGQVYHVLNGSLAADAGHLNELGSRLAAAEFIRVATGSAQ